MKSSLETGHWKTGDSVKKSYKTSVRIVQNGGGGSPFFFRWVGWETRWGVEIFFDTGLKKRCGVEFYHQLSKKEVIDTINQVCSVSLLLEISSKEAHTVCHSNIISHAPIRFVLLYTVKSDRI